MSRILSAMEEQIANYAFTSSRLDGTLLGKPFMTYCMENMTSPASGKMSAFCKLFTSVMSMTHGEPSQTFDDSAKDLNDLQGRAGLTLDKVRARRDNKKNFMNSKVLALAQMHVELGHWAATNNKAFKEFFEEASGDGDAAYNYYARFGNAITFHTSPMGIKAIISGMKDPERSMKEEIKWIRENRTS